MASNAELVGNFIGIVDGALVNQVKDADSTWPGMYTRATLNGLAYISIGSGDARCGPVRPGPEHRWGIAAPGRRAGVLAAQIALIAVEGRDETLLRSVMVETPRLPVWTERELTGEELVGALAWARFPQSHEATLAQLAVLGLDEKTRMSAEYRAQLAEQAELSLELREVQEADLAGWSAKGTLIGAV